MYFFQPFMTVNNSPPVIVSYVGLTAISGTTDTVTQTGVPIGTPASNRYVFINVHWNNNVVAAALLSATIGGVTAKLHVNIGTGTGNSNFLGVAIISALVPTGTTATVVLNFASGAGSHHPFLETYQVTNLVSDTPGATSSATPVSVQPYSGSIDVVAGGLLLVAASTWSGATGYTLTGPSQDYTDLQATGFYSVGGSLAVSTTQAGFPFGISRTGGSGTTFNAAVAAAAFR